MRGLPSQQRSLPSLTSWPVMVAVYLVAVYLVYLGNAVKPAYGLITKDVFFLPVDAYRVAQFQVNYIDYGLVRRGIIGTLFRLLPWDVTFSLSLFSTLCMLANLFLFLRLVRIALKKFAGENDQLWFLFLCLSSPLLFTQWGYTAEFHDSWLLLIALLSVWVITSAMPAGILALLLALAVLVHEVFIFFYAPMLLVLYYQRRVSPDLSQGRQLAKILCLALPMTIATCVVGLQGNMAVPDYHRLQQKVAVDKDDKAGRQLGALALKVWRRSSAENVAYSLKKLGERFSQPVHIIGLGCALLMLYAYSYIIRQFGRQLGWPPRRWLWLAGLAVCSAPAFVMGHDWGRWLAMLGDACWIYMLVQIGVSNRGERPLALAGIRWNKPLLIIALLGPIGVTHFFPAIF